MHSVIFICCSFTLREFTVSSLGKRLVISISQASNRTGHPCYVILFCRSCGIHHDCNLEFTWISQLSALFILWQIHYDNLTKIYFSARWLVRANLQNRDMFVSRLKSSQDSGFPSKSGRSRLNWDGWTLCKTFRVSGDMLPRKKK